MNLDNLKLLMDHIRDNVTDDELYMTTYQVGKDITRDNFETLKSCGTVGCALGHAPFVPGLEPLDEEFYGGEHGQLNYQSYVDRVFNTNTIMLEWGFLFSADWELVSEEMSNSSKLQLLMRYEYYLAFPTGRYINYPLASIENMKRVEEWGNNK